MPDLHWTIPVARWSSWPAAASAAPDIGFIEPIVRRRLSTLSRVALKVAHDCVAGSRSTRVVFASRHGELRRTTDILRNISAGEPVSPTAFSLSVLNAMTGVFGIARGDRSAASAISAGAETLGYALLEALRAVRHAAGVAGPARVRRRTGRSPRTARSKTKCRAARSRSCWTRDADGGAVDLHAPAQLVCKPDAATERSRQRHRRSQAGTRGSDSTSVSRPKARRCNTAWTPASLRAGRAPSAHLALELA